MTKMIVVCTDDYGIGRPIIKVPNYVMTFSPLVLQFNFYFSVKGSRCILQIFRSGVLSQIDYGNLTLGRFIFWIVFNSIRVRRGIMNNKGCSAFSCSVICILLYLSVDVKMWIVLVVFNPIFQVHKPWHSTFWQGNGGNSFNNGIGTK